MRYLLIEDDSLVSATISACLNANGYQSAGMAATVDEALRLIPREKIDFALLDLNLGGSDVSPVISALEASETRVLLISGYTVEGRPPWARNLPLLTKPFLPSDLFQAIGQLMSS